MVIGILQVEMLLSGTMSLKDKRSLLSHLKNSLRKQFNISVAELRYHDQYGRALLGITTINNESKIVSQILSQVEKHIEMQNNVQILNRKIELV